MLSNLTIGQFFPGESPIHRMDPRTKLLGTVFLLVSVFVCKGFLGLGLSCGFVALAAIQTGIGLRFFLKGLKPIVFIVCLTFLLNLFTQKGGEVLLQVWSITIWEEGLRSAAFLAVRLTLLVLSGQLLTLTTSPIALTDGLESLMRPLSRIHFPAHEIAMMMSIALRFIPTLLEEADKIMKAQSARGADFESGSILHRAKAMVPLLVPLFVSAFRRADELAMAMEARCYRGGTGRTRMRVLHYGAVDGMGAAALALLLGSIIVLNTWLPL